MAQCVVPDEAGVLHVTADDPCTGLVVLTPPEYGALNASPLNLSAEDGFTLSVAILGVWGSAFFFRALARALDLGSNGSD